MRHHAPATSRNRQPILEVLQRVLPESGLVLEVASGSGEHALYMAKHLPALSWQPSDADDGALSSIGDWRTHEGSENLLPPVHIDASSREWPVTAADALVCINMVHISPWPATLGLLDGASRILPPNGLLYLYGPYILGDRVTAVSNLAFDESLRARNPAWGVRDLADVESAARQRSLDLREVVDMPANNLSLILRKVVD